MTRASCILRAAEAEPCLPWLRHILSRSAWVALAEAALTEAWILIAHWADTLHAHALFLDPAALTVIPVSTPLEAGHYPALSPLFPVSAWFERLIRDLWGHQADGGVDLRPWLDHGQWPLSPPMAARPEAYRSDAPANVAAAPAAADAMVLPLGPVWGRLEEAAHLRLVLDGSSICHAEALLGFTHKGVLTLMRGKSPRVAARFVARLSADATVAHSVAFAQAIESAMDVAIPARAAGLRVVMMEIERVAVHLDNLAEVGRLSGASNVWTRCGTLREILLRAAEASFGHRLLMDCVTPGGVAADITAGGPEVILRALGDIASALPTIRRLHNGPALTSRLTGLGRAGRNLASALGVGGVVGRASGHAFDLRTAFAPSYRDLLPRVAGQRGGDAAARQQLRMLEIEESLRLIGMALDILPDGPVTAILPQASGEGIGCAESARGDVWHWIRLDHGQIATTFIRDPGWALWPLAERVLEHASADDVDLLRTSFALPASGIDL